MIGGGMIAGGGNLGGGGGGGPTLVTSTPAQTLPFNDTTAVTTRVIAVTPRFALTGSHIVVCLVQMEWKCAGGVHLGITDTDTGIGLFPMNGGNGAFQQNNNSESFPFGFSFFATLAAGNHTLQLSYNAAFNTAAITVYDAQITVMIF